MPSGQTSPHLPDTVPGPFYPDLEVPRASPTLSVFPRLSRFVVVTEVVCLEKETSLQTRRVKNRGPTPSTVSKGLPLGVGHFKERPTSHVRLDWKTQTSRHTFLLEECPPNVSFRDVYSCPLLWKRKGQEILRLRCYCPETKVFFFRLYTTLKSVVYNV